MSIFGQVVRIAFWGCLEFNLLLLYLVFVFFPYMTIIAMRRIHIKNKVKRKMIRTGMPRKKAKIYAKRYQSFLAGYGSIKGILKFTRKARQAAKKEKVNNIVSYSIVS
ncbi:MAG: hypothetical protein GNW80_09460 [Asgard group archaeon]|nr:hypothetical protein [Asgard group archaeon]